jgi:carbon-monoxide dehydrogenase medium subunit
LVNKHYRVKPVSGFFGGTVPAVVRFLVLFRGFDLEGEHAAVCGGHHLKAPAFDYVRPDSLRDVFALMAKHGDDARILAGGQTLLATLNMRLSEPAILIDINRVVALKGIAVDGDVLRIGALTTHREIEESAMVARVAPLLAKAAPHIAHRAIRNRGTFGGSIAYADPAAEWPTCLLALDGTVVVQGPDGERRIAAEDFFIDLYTTALDPGEVIVACEVPVATDADTFAFDELARRHGDYAIVGLAVALRRERGMVTRSRLVVLNVATTAVRAKEAEALLTGRSLEPDVVEAAVAALAGEIDPTGDLTSDAATKRHLAGVLAHRLLASLA